MICKKYDALTHSEKVVMIGELVHCVQSDDSMFELAQYLISLGRSIRLLDNVKILPDEEKQ